MVGIFARLFGGGDAAPARQEPQLLPAVIDQAPAVADQAPKPLPQWSTAELLPILGGIESFAGPIVTAETAMRVSAVFACVRTIAGAIACLPLHVFKAQGEDRARARAHPVDWILNGEPNRVMTPAVFLEYLVASILLAGDAFCLIGRTVGGGIIDLVPIDPRCVQVRMVDGVQVYLIQGYDGQWFAVDQSDVLHIPGVGFNMRTGRGMSVIGWAARQAIGAAMAAEEYSARFFSNGARPDVVLKYPNKLTPDQVEQLRTFWMRKHSGLQNAHTPAVLTEGGDIETLTMTAEDAQLIATRQFQVEDIARAFGVPPFMIGQTDKTTSWGSGVETMGIGFVTYTLRPYLTKIEQEINRKLLGTGRFFAEFNVTGLLRGDSKARAEFYRSALGGSSGPGWMKPNEVRRLENLPQDADPQSDKLTTGTAPAPGGDPDKGAPGKPPAAPDPAEPGQGNDPHRPFHSGE